jgi:hypothetical protein
MQKLVFRSALGPNQISFSHSQDPKQTLRRVAQSSLCRLNDCLPSAAV